MLTDVLTVLGLIIAVVALLLTLGTIRQLRSIETLTSSAHDLQIKVRKEFSDFDASQRSAVEELTEIAARSETTLAAVARINGVSEEEVEQVEEEVAHEEEQADPVPEYARMYAISTAELPREISEKVRRQANSDITWALRRRGRGRPRWLVGTDSGGPWRVTARQGGPAVAEVPTLAEKIRPVGLDDLDVEAETALQEETGLDRARFDDLVFHRVAPGAPVYFAVVHPIEGPSEVWRLVKTRWGWNASPEQS